ncbi:hypothetical protein ACIQC9_02920 [Brevundimonas sp. NPDC092305]|uniref:hypothetical protein n=1 Tax=Brevundimonas sp. NPDC092305 TaxID=3363957 RepID=UPI0037F77485
MELYRRASNGSTLAGVELLRAHAFDRFFPNWSGEQKEQLLLSAARMGDSEAALELADLRFHQAPRDKTLVLEALDLVRTDSIRAAQLRSSINVTPWGGV